MKVCNKTFHENGIEKEEVSILTSDKIDVKSKLVKRERAGLEI